MSNLGKLLSAIILFILVALAVASGLLAWRMK